MITEQDIKALAELRDKLTSEPEVKITLTLGQLSYLADVFHNYKDCYRDCKPMIQDAMEFEQELVKQTNGQYYPDTTYDWKE
jgi:hypothetical protein